MPFLSFNKFPREQIPPPLFFTIQAYACSLQFIAKIHFCSLRLPLARFFFYVPPSFRHFCERFSQLGNTGQLSSGRATSLHSPAPMNLLTGKAPPPGGKLPLQSSFLFIVPQPTLPFYPFFIIFSPLLFFFSRFLYQVLMQLGRPRIKWVLPYRATSFTFNS